VLVTIVALVLQTLIVGVLAAASPAAAAGRQSGVVDAVGGFPTWYQDSAGNRVEPCTDTNDPNCVLAASATFDPAQPVAFPTNYPDEFFYALADSDLIPTAGCAGTVPGRASVRIALEGAFLNGDPVAGEQMTFGRIRVKVTSGLCPNTTYHFKHPFGTETFTTNAAGGVPPNAGTDDVGCLGFVPPARCDFNQANTSRVFGSATDGFLRWDGTAPAAPTGYLGDGATLHPITGGTSGNSFAILDANNNDLGLSTSLFTVAGKLAGSLAGSPSPLDFGGQAVTTTSAPQSVTVTNLDSSAVTVGASTITGGDATLFAAAPAAGPTGCAVGTVLSRDQSCTVAVTFTPTIAGRVSSTLEVASTGGYRSPLRVAVTGRGINAGSAPSISLTPNPMSFLDTRVRTVSATRSLSIGNTGSAPLEINKVFLDSSQGADAGQFQITRDTCTGTFVDPATSCTVDLVFAPSVVGAKASSLRIESNDSGSPHFVPVTGTATGGVAAVSAGTDPTDGFPDWYRDENGVKLSQCIDPNDPNCVVLPDATFDPANALHFPDNFPGEFFYTVSDSDIITTPGCNGSNPGKAFMRSAVEGTFLNGVPVDKEQMTFGRIRFAVTGGLCPNTDYTFTYPYGQETFTTNANGGLARARATDDVGCVPVLPDTPCDFSAALSSRVFGGFLRWDPSVAPAAPAGYLGDAATFHKVVGAPFSLGGSPVNYFKITAANGDLVGQTDQFTVMGKLRGPLEADTDTLELTSTPVGSTSGSATVTYTNTGIAPLTISSLAVTGVDAGDFTLAGGTCAAGLTLAVGDTCTAQVSFSPTATGDRDASLVVRHTGLNDPMIVHLHGIGGAVGSSAAISFAPRSVAFGPLHTGDVSDPWRVSISNAGGTLPLDVNSLALAGPGAASFSIDPNTDTCSGTHVAGGASCTVDLVFSPTSAGAKTANLVVTDNAPGGTHTLALTGTGSDAVATVSASTDADNGFPQWYGDRTGTRVAPCLDPADTNCIVLADAGFNPANPVAFPTNFPGEFFYSIADSDVMATPGCGAQSAAGTALVRTALEGSFAGGSPAANSQITFGRLRVTVTSGLCPNAQYLLITPWGTQPITANATGGIARNGATEDTGCNPVAPATCDFSAALGSRIAKSFPRWDPAVAPAAPAGYLGNPVALHPIVGGTYIPPAASYPVNYVEIADLAGNTIVKTNKFLVSGKVAGPFVTDKNSVDVGHTPIGTPGPQSTVTVTNVATTATTVSSVTLGGTNANQFTISGGSCTAGSPVASDATCTVQVRLNPTTAGVKNATLTVTPATGPAVTVKLTGTADPAAQPAISVTPGVLAYGTVTAPATSSLSTTIRNTGTAPLVIGTTPVTGTNAADFTVTSAPCASIPAGGSCLVTVRFAPKATGARTGILTINHNATGGSTQVSLSGTGAGSTFAIAQNPVTFGTVTRNTTKTQSVTVKNTGTLAFRVTAASVSGADAASFAVVNNGAGCVGTQLAAGKTCSLTVSFTPTAVRNYTGVLNVTGDNTSLPATASSTLTGTGK
jgi:hypothetical protein